MIIISSSGFIDFVRKTTITLIKFEDPFQWECVPNNVRELPKEDDGGIDLAKVATEFGVNKDKRCRVSSTLHTNLVCLPQNLTVNDICRCLIRQRAGGGQFRTLKLASWIKMILRRYFITTT